MCAAYGDGVTPAGVLTLAPERLDELAVLTAARELHSHVDLYQADASYIREHRAMLLGDGPPRA
jgi:hypothetical protein